MGKNKLTKRNEQLLKELSDIQSKFSEGDTKWA